MTDEDFDADEVEAKITDALDAVMRRAVKARSTESTEFHEGAEGQPPTVDLVLDLDMEAIIAKVRSDWREALDTLGSETASDDRAGA